MKTALAFKTTPRPAAPLTDAEARAMFDTLVRRSWTGDRRALGTLAIAFGSTLLGEARAIVGAHREEDAADIVQDFYVVLLERRGRWPPRHGSTARWVRERMRQVAGRYG